MDDDRKGPLSGRIGRSTEKAPRGARRRGHDAKEVESLPHRHASRARARSAEYEAYLQSPEWQERRRRALERDGHRCRVCNSTDRLEVHHRTYARFGAEADDDLTTLCSACHGLFHHVERDDDEPAIQPGAAPPADKLYELLLNSPEFSAAWGRLRPDFRSQKQYDLSLAYWAVIAGWADDEVAALVGTHRGWDSGATSGYLLSVVRKVRARR